jgi:hypothetical protein
LYRYVAVLLVWLFFIFGIVGVQQFSGTLRARWGLSKLTHSLKGPGFNLKCEILVSKFACTASHPTCTASHSQRVPLRPGASPPEAR